MKLKNIFEDDFIGDDLVMVSLDNDILNGIIRANSSAAFIITCLKDETSTNAIVKKVVEAYGIDKNTAETAVDKIILQLRDLNLINE